MGRAITKYVQRTYGDIGGKLATHRETWRKTVQTSMGLNGFKEAKKKKKL